MTLVSSSLQFNSAKFRSQSRHKLLRILKIDEIPPFNDLNCTRVVSKVTRSVSEGGQGRCINNCLILVQCFARVGVPLLRTLNGAPILKHPLARA
jgi:hypothetical protein